MQARPYPRSCVACGEVAVQPAKTGYDAQIKHDGRIHRFHIRDLVVDKCQRCGEVLFTTRTNEQITAALRDFLGLLHPDDLRRRLVELGLTGLTLAELLGVGPETVSRWLSGLAVQPSGLDHRMRLVLGLRETRAQSATDDFS